MSSFASRLRTRASRRICRLFTLASSGSGSASSASTLDAAATAAAGGGGGVRGSAGGWGVWRFADVVVGACIGFTAFEFGSFVLAFPEACEALLDTACIHRRIREEVGVPLRHSIFWDGSVEKRKASVIIPVSGPKGKATLQGRAVYLKGEWQPVMLQAHFQGELHTVDLLQDKETAVQPADTGIRGPESSRDLASTSVQPQ